jgi:NCS1 family nucleobase:cation symporter-1
VGVVVSVPFMANGFFTGPVGASLAGADLSYFLSGIVAALVYLAARRWFTTRVPNTGRTAQPGEVSHLQKSD